VSKRRREEGTCRRRGHVTGELQFRGGLWGVLPMASVLGGRAHVGHGNAVSEEEEEEEEDFKQGY